MTSVRLHPVAYRDVRAARAWYRRRNLDAARAFGAEVKRAIDELAVFPLIGALGGDGFRRLPLRGFPFLVIYRYERDAIDVMAVAHARRKPGFWLDRKG